MPLKCPVMQMKQKISQWDGSPAEGMEPNDCLFTDCSWYVENACGIAVIAKALYSMDEYGVRQATHE